MILCSFSLFAQQFTSPHGLEHVDRNPDYKSVIDFYKQIAGVNKNVSLRTVGATDTDEPLMVVFYSGDGKFNTINWKEEGKTIILINNAIHPGEPDGIVASMQLLWDVSHNVIKIPGNIVLAIIPVFNISGATRLREHSRANQNGPALTGFRGNAQNLDLNRDFIKMDARETRSLVYLFDLLKPDILIDNHVSNGADYQHIMTLLSTQHNKLGGPMGKYLNSTFEPAIYKDMKKQGYDLVPYVNVWGTTPDKGWPSFLEIPRFLSGYAAIKNTYAFVAETHMLKPFSVRVRSTYALMHSIIDFAATHANELSATRLEQADWIAKSTELAIDWAVDTTKPTMIELKGYEGGMKPSDISGQPRLYYDRNKPFVKQVPFYNTCTVSHSVTVPVAYVIPQGWNKVVTRLKLNGVKMEQLNNDTVLALTVYHITGHKTGPDPYEGHYLHTDVEVSKDKQQLQLRKGDYIIRTAQPAKRYLVEVLEPTAPDAFFAWGFFDAILQQKEHYSAYVFEDLATEMLTKDAGLKALYEQKKMADPEFAKDGNAQLHFIYNASGYHEPEHMRYPVFRLE
ncbi:MAG: hypothetical protein H6550_07615 [Chitinophagales bacterium]|nr:hypothetical protein [Chitinophagales bacterium]